MNYTPLFTSRKITKSNFMKKYKTKFQYSTYHSINYNVWANSKVGSEFDLKNFRYKINPNSS